MALPSKPQQIAAVTKFLDSDFTEGKSLEEVAKAIVNGYHDALVKDLKKPATTLRLGMLFKMPLDAKVRRVAWMDDSQVWVVSETDSYGWLGALEDPLWGVCEEFYPKTAKLVDGKRKMFEMTDDEIAEAWSNPDWVVGDKLSLGQRQHSFEVIATGPKNVLLRDVKTGRLNADDNSSLDKHYQKEVKVGEVAW